MFQFFKWLLMELLAPFKVRLASWYRYVSTLRGGRFGLFILVLWVFLTIALMAYLNPYAVTFLPGRVGHWIGVAQAGPLRELEEFDRMAEEEWNERWAELVFLFSYVWTPSLEVLAEPFISLGFDTSAVTFYPGWEFFPSLYTLCLTWLSSLSALTPLWAAGLNPTLLGFLFLCLACLFIFLAVVLIRITVPRFKLESLSKLGWQSWLAVLSLFVLAFLLGFFLI